MTSSYRYLNINNISITAAIIAVVMLLSFSGCSGEKKHMAPAVSNRDQLPILKSKGVSTLISDSGVIRYKIVAEEWYIYDKTDPSKWSFEKGLYLQKFDQKFHVDASIQADTAYFYDQKKLWELKGNVFIRNQRGDRFYTELLYWDQITHKIYSPIHVKIEGIDRRLEGADFTANEEMTDYLFHKASGALPMADKQANNDSIKRAMVRPS